MHFPIGFQLSDKSESIMLVGIKVRKAHIGILQSTGGEKCKSQFYPREYSHLVFPIVVTVRV